MPTRSEPSPKDRPTGGIVRRADPGDVEAAHQIRLAAAADLTTRFGQGHWSYVSDIAGLRQKAADGLLYVADMDDAVVGTMLITPERISFYRLEWFSRPATPAAYLMDMSVHPTYQRRQVGRRMMQAADGIAREQNLDGIRLDAYQGRAGAGPFYRKCGYRLVHRGEFRGIDLEYYERDFPAPSAGTP